MTFIKYFCLLCCLWFSQTLRGQSADIPYLIILGTAQDGGYPHIGCKKKCCELAWKNEKLKRFVVSLALVDPRTKQWWLFEATPDIKEQLHYFQALTNSQYKYLPDGVFLTHAHMGHYAGLMQLGREALGAKDVSVYAMPRMKEYLENNGPWSQLVKLHNIAIQSIDTTAPIPLTAELSVQSFRVQHRDEYSETVGFNIITTNRKYLFIPDIDKWNKWDRPIIDKVKSVDIALLDGTFYDDTELPGRSMSEVPHPFIIESEQLFANEVSVTKSKVRFIHFNHTNPLLWDNAQQKKVRSKGFNIAVQGEKL